MSRCNFLRCDTAFHECFRLEDGERMKVEVSCVVALVPEGGSHKTGI